MLFDIMQTCRMFVKPMRSKSLVVIWLLVLTISAKSIFSRSLGESGKSRSVRSPPVTEDEVSKQCIIKWLSLLIILSITNVSGSQLIVTETVKEIILKNPDKNSKYVST